MTAESVLVRPDDSGFYYFADCDDTDWARTAHLFLRDRTQPFGPEGVPLGRMYRASVSESPVIAATPDGGFWYVTERDELPRPVVRAVRIAPDGSVAAESPVLVEELVAGRDLPMNPIRTYGLRGEVAEDGGYYLHFVTYDAPPPDTTPPASHFYRFAPDGSIVWSWTAPPGLVATGPGPFYSGERVAPYAGGVVALVSLWNDAGLPYRLLRIDPDGSRPLGDEGRELEWEPSAAGLDLEHRTG